MTDVTINLSPEAHQLLRNMTEPGYRFSDNSVRRADGTFDVKVDSDTLERLTRLQLEGENLSDTLIRIAALIRSKPH